MLNWLAQNWGTILVCVILAAVIVLIIAWMVRNKKAGRSSCCGDCKACTGACSSCGKQCSSSQKNPLS